MTNQGSSSDRAVPLVILMGLIGFLGTGSHVAATDPPTSTDASWGERVEWVGVVEPGGVVAVDNPYGDVRARFGGWQGRVEVLANVQHLHPGGVRLRVRVDETEQGLSVVIDYPAGTPTEVGDRSRADLAVLVPHGSDLEATTDTGVIDCKGLDGDVEARTRTGDITVRSLKGAVQANSVLGSILAVLEPGVTDREQRLRTRTGDVVVHLAPSADIAVEASTSGRICTDFSIDIQHRDGEEPDKSATAIVGDPRRRLMLRTLRGEIRIMRRLPVDRESKQEDAE